MWVVKFLALFFIGLGLVKYRERVQNVTGPLGFAEHYLGTGGTYTFYLMLGIGFMIFSFFYATGTTDALFEATIGRFFFRPE